MWSSQVVGFGVVLAEAATTKRTNKSEDCLCERGSSDTM